MNHFRFHIGDYMKDTSHLSLLEHGVYMRLIQVYYTREAPIPEDQAARLVGARSTEEREALAVVLKEFFRVADGTCHQSRCQAEIDEWHLLSAEQAAKGRAGAAKRWADAKNSSGQEIHGKRHSAGHRKDSNGHDPAIEKNGRSMASQLPTPNSQVKEGEAHPSKEVRVGAESNGGSPPKARKGTRIPEDFSLTDGRRAVAVAEGISPDRTFAKFKDFWRAATKNASKCDWDATWRNWCRNEAERNPKPKGGADNGLPFAN